MDNKKLGDLGEDIAVKYLESKGYKIINRNYRSQVGEIDIIAFNKFDLVFIEVKTRSSINYGYAYEAVDQMKQEKIINTALYYIQKERVQRFQPRFDIIEVYTKDGKINHIINAFS
ncbi:MAG: YraN family protein [Tissierellia bacterium]|nr:YraN family protein [Tissierellia bacterium]